MIYSINIYCEDILYITYKSMNTKKNLATNRNLATK